MKHETNIEWEEVTANEIAPLRYLYRIQREAKARGLSRFEIIDVGIRSMAKKYPKYRMGAITGIPLIVDKIK